MLLLAGEKKVEINTAKYKKVYTFAARKRRRKEGEGKRIKTLEI